MYLQRTCNNRAVYGGWKNGGKDGKVSKYGKVPPLF